MKHIYTLSLVILSALTSFAQGNIDQITVSPANPTTDDVVTVYADMWFNYGGCPLDNKYHYMNGNSILATSHHCIGLAAVICPATDTFELGQLAAGTYSFELSITSGSGPVPCTPGFAIDDMDTLTFTVSQAVGIEHHDLGKLQFENPVSGKLSFGTLLTEPMELYDITGKPVRRLDVGTSSVDLHDLTPGIYFLRSSNGVKKLVLR